MIASHVLKEKFQSGKTFAQFQAEATHHREELQRFYEAFSSLPAEEVRAFQELVKRHGGRVHVLALAEDWCGDAARALPLLARLCEAVDGLELRLQSSDAPENAELAQAWPKGERHPIPILVFLDGNFEEIGHWVERPVAGDAFLEARRQELKDLPEKRFFARVRPLMMEAFESRLWREALAEWRAALGG